MPPWDLAEEAFTTDYVWRCNLRHGGNHVPAIERLERKASDSEWRSDVE